MKQYHQMLKYILAHGQTKQNRTGVNSISVFGYQVRFDLTCGFPLLTTKRVYLKGIIYELLWFLAGRTDVAYLKEHNVNIWNDWVKSDGSLGPIYGKQWRSWSINKDNSVDQIKQVIDGIKQDPYSRRLLVSAWNVSDLGDMALYPCHVMFQYAVMNGRLYCHVYQRSADLFLGVPFNIASYALLLLMIAQVCSLECGDLIFSYGDLHIYDNHIEQVKLQLSRSPRTLPKMKLNTAINNIDDFKYADFTLVGYNPYEKISAPIAV